MNQLLIMRLWIMNEDGMIHFRRCYTRQSQFVVKCRRHVTLPRFQEDFFFRKGPRIICASNTEHSKCGYNTLIFPNLCCKDKLRLSLQEKRTSPLIVTVLRDTFKCVICRITPILPATRIVNTLREKLRSKVRVEHLHFYDFLRIHGQSI